MVADATPLLALAGLIFVKEAGVPVPVPGDLVVIGAGVAASRGDLDPLVILVVLVLASVVGGAVQFGLLRSVARPVILSLLARMGSTRRIDSQTDRLRRSGARGVAIARVTPGLRIVAIAASALAAVPAGAFLTGLIVGNGLFIAGHFGIGLVLGEPVIRIVGSALGPIAAVSVALAAAGAVGWVILSRRRPGRNARLAAATDWADACCPACLVLATMSSPAT
jgi:membrane protein DedA with SNARE-associated domain